MLADQSMEPLGAGVATGGAGTGVAGGGGAGGGGRAGGAAGTRRGTAVKERVVEPRVLPAASRAVAVTECVPAVGAHAFASEVSSSVKGAVPSVRQLPSMQNCIFAAPAATAAMSTFAGSLERSSVSP